MKYWKVRASAIGLTMVMLVPGMAYGQGKDAAYDLERTDQQIQNRKTCYQIIPKEDGTYCNGWNWVWNQSDQTASAVAAEMLESVNGQRRAVGLDELTLSTELSRVAQIKAEDMRDQGYFSHTSPTYGSPFDMMKKFGISYRSAGENIAKGYRTVDAVMNGWMNSSGHRANILSSSYTQLGVGYCTDSAGNGYWVQMFIR